jgi:hypothetical protein
VTHRPIQLVVERVEIDCGDVHRDGPSCGSTLPQA